MWTRANQNDATRGAHRSPYSPRHSHPCACAVRPCHAPCRIPFLPFSPYFSTIESSDVTNMLLSPDTIPSSVLHLYVDLNLLWPSPPLLPLLPLTTNTLLRTLRRTNRIPPSSAPTDLWPTISR